MNDFIEKLIALARDGVGCERDVALRKLREYCQKNGIDFDKLSFDGEPVIERRPFKIPRGKEAEHLWAQVYMMVRNVHDVRYKDWRQFSDKAVLADCTKQEQIEIMFAFEVYWAEYQRLKKNLLHAFMFKNHIHPRSRNPEPQGNTKPVKRDWDAILGLAMGMPETTINKAIEDKGDA